MASQFNQAGMVGYGSCLQINSHDTSTEQSVARTANFGPSSSLNEFPSEMGWTPAPVPFPGSASDHMEDIELDESTVQPIFGPHCHSMWDRHALVRNPPVESSLGFFASKLEDVSTSSGPSQGPQHTPTSPFVPYLGWDYSDLQLVDVWHAMQEEAGMAHDSANHAHLAHLNYHYDLECESHNVPNPSACCPPWNTLSQCQNEAPFRAAFPDVPISPPAPRVTTSLVNDIPSIDSPPGVENFCTY